MTAIRERCPGCGHRHVLLPIGDQRLCIACMHAAKATTRKDSTR